jgi:ribosomal protein S18 acetylase RimI-like enzyme
MDIKYESLKNIGLKEVYDVFIDAFSNYQIKLDVSYEKFSNMMKRRSVDFSVSMGIFDGNKLIGFVLNGKRIISNKLTAYDAGTGILQDYQGLKLGKKMLQKNIELLEKNNFDKYILEVITTNEKAFKLYQSFGFKIARKFECFKNTTMSINEFEPNTNIKVGKIEFSNINWDKVTSYFDFNLSWQNSATSIKEDVTKFLIFQAVYKKQSVGYGIIETKTGDIPLLAVNKKYRNRLIGSMILKKMKEEAYASNLSILNIPPECSHISNFLDKHNFENFAQQYEMEYCF